MRTTPLALTAVLALAALAGLACEGSDPADPPVEFTLAVTLAGDGAGTVTSLPAGISCGGAGTACSAAFEEGTDVVLTATPESGHDFAGWDGGCAGSGACAITVAADATVEAAFEDPLTESAAIGPEGGSVASPDGRVVLEIPAGALGNAETITIRVVDPADLGAEFDLEGFADDPLAYELGPDGLTFASPITVRVETGDTLDDDGVSVAMVPGTLLTSEGGEAVGLEALAVEVDAETGAVTMTGQLSHFSPLVRMTLNGQITFQVDHVPHVLGVGQEFTAIALLDAGTLEIEGDVAFRDFSVLPIRRLFESNSKDLELLDGGGATVATGELPYVCESEGTGMFDGMLFFHVELPDETYGFPGILRVQREIRCLPVPEPVYLADAEGAEDGVGGFVRGDGAVGGRSSGRPATWFFGNEGGLGELTSFLPGHPDVEDGPGFIFGGSEDGAVLGGMVLDEAFGMHPSIWDDAHLAMLDIGAYQGGSVRDVSPDGAFAVGSLQGGPAPFVPAAWERDGTPVPLEMPEGATTGGLTAVNADGIAVGYYDDADGRHGGVWDLNEGGFFVEMPDPGVTGSTQWNDINADGLMVGQRSDPETGYYDGLIWDPATETHRIVTAPAGGPPSIRLVGASDNGLIVCNLAGLGESHACLLSADPEANEGMPFVFFQTEENTLPAGRGISRDGAFLLGGTDDGSGIYSIGWVFPVNPLTCPFCE